MAKSRAQRKAEQRKRQAARQQGGAEAEAKAQHDTQVPESAEVVEAELAERGADLDQLKGDPGDAEAAAPAPSRGETAPARSEPQAEPAEPRQSRRELRRLEKERREAAKAQVERRKPREAPVERERGRVLGFFVSCVAELRRVQWPTRDTLIQASAVTVVFITVAAAYLGVLDAAFNWVVNRII
ncbi:MAG: preprotein translocase subunit SecE [Actinomycetota bacterium]|nr:preprotein translocase subunit SecE [Actinomycetota bacterium]